MRYIKAILVGALVMVCVALPFAPANAQSSNSPVLATVIQTISLYNAPTLNAQVVGLLTAGQHWFIEGTDTTGNWALVQITLLTSGWTIRRALSIPGTVPIVTGVTGGGVFAFSAGSGRAFTYIVKSGNTLGALALRFGTTVATLARINKIVNPDLIFVGQRLIIP
ncbi:MAG: LysM peptidoglycan-binding domain-containing protein [Aggregatilineales bacterium]